ncbi:hypothetical protein QBC46DRAFT_126982 [Diplogelasinospora grovesii]|uniref:Subtelomeric hrmA-associated cluster protein AFUB-079030/YDR124W-like helical bundle domain-containing protein n=1 Tax=Diplogelasinospora grovesii TaxID=303347 RepID=A0AAN6N705_9PEZI|nr:hypothetical protein QBC46DRAFT_126982 [Diplogelasinospora grovesii]
MVTDWVRGQYARPQWQADRPTLDHHTAEDTRYYEAAAVRRPPLTIDTALREQCNINYQTYFLAAFLDDGTWAFFSGPNRIPDSAIPKIFQKNQFLQLQKRSASMGGSYADDPGFPYDDLYERESVGPSYAGRRGYDRRRGPMMDPFDDDELPSFKTRKRPRANVRRDPDDDEPPVTVSTKKGMKIGNADDVWEFYSQRFRNCQQTACKLIAKAWVKAVEPKKQSNHPYTGSDEKAPDWWPKPWGTTRDDKVRHKEPDHLYKKERVHLLCHILRMVVEPNAKQHPDIQKLYLTVAKLEEATNEALSTFFADKDNTNNAKKKPFLKEIFKVAKVEERYKRGEIDPDTEVFIMADDKMADSYQSDNDEARQSRDEADEHDRSGSASRVSPPKTTGPPHVLLSSASADHNHQNSAGNLAGGPPFISEIPVRGPQYPTAGIMPSSELTSDQHATYVEAGGTMGGVGGGQAAPSLQTHSTTTMHQAMQDLIPSPHPHDHPGSRRSSMFVTSSPTDFQPNSSVPAGPGAGLYSASAWGQQQAVATCAPGTSGLYAFTPHAHHQHQQHSQSQQPQQAQAGTAFISQQQQTVAISQTQQQYIGSSSYVDGLSPHSHTPHTHPHPSNLYRTSSSSIGQGHGQGALAHHGPGPGGYSNFGLPHDGRTVTNTGLKIEPPLNRGLH